MTTIFTPETGEVHTLQLTSSSGVDFLADVMGNSGVPISTEADFEEADFELSLEDYRWWRKWAANEQVINDTMTELGVGEQMEVPCFYDQRPDWEDAQRAYAEYLGIELAE